MFLFKGWFPWIRIQSFQNRRIWRSSQNRVLGKNTPIWNHWATEIPVPTERTPSSSWPRRVSETKPCEGLKGPRGWRKGLEPFLLWCQDREGIVLVCVCSSSLRPLFWRGGWGRICFWGTKNQKGVFGGARSKICGGEPTKTSARSCVSRIELVNRLSGWGSQRHFCCGQYFTHAFFGLGLYWETKGIPEGAAWDARARDSLCLRLQRQLQLLVQSQPRLQGNRKIFQDPEKAGFG